MIGHKSVSPIINDTLLSGLACATVQADLRSILLYDAPHEELMNIGTLFSYMLEKVVGREVPLIMLGAAEQDDDLWGNLSVQSLRHSASDSSVTWTEGLLTDAWNTNDLRLVVIPDLSSISLAAARACVALVSADVAHLERHGQSKRWRPRTCWLANCAHSRVGAVSPHLLDRFVLRLSWRSTALPDRLAQLRNNLLHDVPFDEPPTLSIPPTLLTSIKQATTMHATVQDPAVLEYILSYFTTFETITSRRELALARLAVAVARLEGSSEVKVIHVDLAAYILGLIATPPQRPREEQRQTTQDLAAMVDETVQQSMSMLPPLKNGCAEPVEIALSAPVDLAITVSQSESVQVVEPIYAPDQPVFMEMTMLPINPYPEDQAAMEREAASLRLPLFRHSAKRSSQGAIIGVERTRTLQDLALVSTMLAAAPFQPFRHLHCNLPMEQFLLSPIDLRGYRREPAAEHLLLILLDYTCLNNCDWQAALLPFLRKAYVERASIGIIQVGAATATHELQAELVSARSILVPRIGEALETSGGKASPLAHGLDIALNTLRHALQHGRNTIQRATFVVLSDGRGNVPLAMSRNGRIIPPVGRQGIEDALIVAEQFHTLKNVSVLYLNPQPRYHYDLPLTLAEALGAELQPIPRLGEEV